jgi:hypothetical protein
MDGPASTAQQTRSSDITAQASLNDLRHSLHGVGGWLLLFICTLVFFGPAAHVFSFFSEFRHSLQIFAQAPHRYSLYEFYFARMSEF